VFSKTLPARMRACLLASVRACARASAREKVSEQQVDFGKIVVNFSPISVGYCPIIGVCKGFIT